MVAMSSVIEMSRCIAREFNPDKIILFGSHAYGTPKEYSDVDLLVIMPFEGSGFDKSLEILDRVDPRFAIDLIVRRPDDTERRYREFDPLIRDALDQGRVLYERKR
jgi:predicted nucleotidyltransferase